jgi:ribonuclease HI
MCKMPISNCHLSLSIGQANPECVELTGRMVYRVEKRLTIYIDGCSKGNPGRAGIGVVAYQGDEKPIFMLSDEIGVTTNNQAEYKALVSALEYAVSFKAAEVEIRSDSELIVKQMNGSYRVKKAELKPLYEAAQKLASRIENLSLRAIPREQNREADALANKALKG